MILPSSFNFKSLGALELCESPLGGLEDLLAAGELEGGTSQSLNGVLDVVVSASNGNQRLSNIDTRAKSIGLSVRVAHTRLKPIGSSTRQHLVDTQNVERVDAHAQVVRLFSRRLLHVLVGRNTGSLQSLARNLLQLIGQHVHTRREVIHTSRLLSLIVEANLGVGDTTAESRLDVTTYKESETNKQTKKKNNQNKERTL